jgi:hypothetical protein
LVFLSINMDISFSLKIYELRAFDFDTKRASNGKLSPLPL